MAGCEWGAVSDKRGVWFGAKPAQPKRPSEPRSGVHREESEVERRCEATQTILQGIQRDECYKVCNPVFRRELVSGAFCFLKSHF